MQIWDVAPHGAECKHSPVFQPHQGLWGRGEKGKAVPMILKKSPWAATPLRQRSACAHTGGTETSECIRSALFLHKKKLGGDVQESQQEEAAMGEHLARRTSSVCCTQLRVCCFSGSLSHQKCSSHHLGVRSPGRTTSEGRACRSAPKFPRLTHSGWKNISAVSKWEQFIK